MTLNVSTEKHWGSRPLPQPWFSLFMGAVGCVLASVAVVSTLHVAEFDRGALRATATVLPESSGAPMTQPFAEFTDADGRVQRVRFHVHSEPPSHHANERVDVLYHRDDPLGAMFDTVLERRFVAILTGLMSLPFLLGSWLAWRFRASLFMKQAARR